MNPFPLRVLGMWINIYHLYVATKVPNMKDKQKCDRLVIYIEAKTKIVKE